nr:MAG TPA: hypothetical protein [Caudoviricetes sp.]
MNTIQYQGKAPGQVLSPGWGFSYFVAILI